MSSRVGAVILLLGVVFAPLPAAAQSFTWLSGSGGFSEANRDRFYSQDQGSRMIPYAWLKALKRLDGQPFLGDSLARYGYLANPKRTDGLPVGFTTLDATGPAMVGMTCSACHTRQIEVAGKPYRIDGGPALADFQSLIVDLDAAMAATADDTAKFAAFAAEVQAIDPSTDPTRLPDLVKDWRASLHAIVSASISGVANHAAWGFGRLDAISMIFNRVTGLDIGSPDRIVPGNMQAADAPTRYPFLWNATTEDKTQWPGFAPNGPLGPALARNVGEVFGVFARFDPQSKFFAVQPYNPSSVNFDGMHWLEDTVASIPAPKWPGTTDKTKSDRGATIFADRCASCHGSAPGNLIVQRPTPVQDVCTDGAENLLLARRVVSAGVLKGALTVDIPPNFLDDQAKVIDVLKVAVVGAILQHYTHFAIDGLLGQTADLDLESAAKDPLSHASTQMALQQAARLAPVSPDLLVTQSLALSRLPTELRDLASTYSAARSATTAPNCVRPDNAPAPYEARYLGGVWAVAPYLHDGSVPTLWDLLSPPAQRPPSFRIGPNYDLTKVGLDNTQPDGFSSLMSTTDCSEINSGRSRCGHVYGVDLSDDDKWALIEYLKVLGQ
jgi:mono/diheme cytochrome c family protein